MPRQPPPAWKLGLAALLFCVLLHGAGAASVLGEEAELLSTTEAMGPTVEDGYGMHCITNPNITSSNPFIQHFRSCRIDQSSLQIAASFAGVLWQWCNGDAYAQAILLLLLVQRQQFFSTMTKGQDTLLQVSGQAQRRAVFEARHYALIALLLRVAMANALDPWLYAVFRQQRPCACRWDSSKPFSLVGTRFGMPSGDVMVTTVVAAHLWRDWNPLIGGILLVGVPLERMVLGFHSLGQVGVGVLFGLGIHVWGTRTPMVTRLLDIAGNAILGPVAFTLAKHALPDYDFGFSVGWANGLVWQLFGVAVLVVSFDQRLLHILLFRPVAEVRSPHVFSEVLRMTAPLVRSGGRGEEGEEKAAESEVLQSPAHKNFMYIGWAVGALFTLLACIRVWAPAADRTWAAL